jgi:hypothetical protein
VERVARRLAEGGHVGTVDAPGRYFRRRLRVQRRLQERAAPLALPPAEEELVLLGSPLYVALVG